VCTLAVRKKNQGRFRYVGSDHSLVSAVSIECGHGSRLNITAANEAGTSQQR
jgi:hypothetical protein